MNYITTRTIFCFWTGTNPISQRRLDCLEQLRRVSECNVILITPDLLPLYILKSAPLHPAFPYLSETHKADYLRTYFMHHHGGGYSDIKQTTGSWVSSFESLEKSDQWCVGFQETCGGVGYLPHEQYYQELIGNCAYIFKPRNPFTTAWYDAMLSLLDTKLEHLRQYPATFPQDRAEISGGRYPIEWNEMLGRIFHRVALDYRGHFLRTLPPCIFSDYR